MSTSAATIFILRRRKVGEGESILQDAALPLLPLVFILAYTGVGASIIIDDPVTASYWSIELRLVFFGLYFAARWARKHRWPETNNSKLPDSRHGISH